MKNSQYIYYEKGYKYRLAKESFYRYFPELVNFRIEEKYFSLIGGWLILHPGYAWDGATKAIDTENFMRSSAVHDCGCQMTDRRMIPYKYRVLFDEELIVICDEDEMHSWRQWWVFKMVRKYSKDINPRVDQRKIYTSPKPKAE